jgi:hypothetical protein
LVNAPMAIGTSDSGEFNKGFNREHMT